MEYFFRNVVKGVFPHTICRRKVAVMDQMADLDKLKPNEGPKKEPKEIKETKEQRGSEIEKQRNKETKISNSDHGK